MFQLLDEDFGLEMVPNVIFHNRYSVYKTKQENVLWQAVKKWSSTFYVPLSW